MRQNVSPRLRRDNPPRGNPPVLWTSLDACFFRWNW